MIRFHTSYTNNWWLIIIGTRHCRLPLNKQQTKVFIVRNRVAMVRPQPYGKSTEYKEYNEKDILKGV
jgi:hypothetical protein